jgi:hypothetical protein
MEKIPKTYNKAKKVFGENIKHFVIYCDSETFKKFGKTTYKGLKVNKLDKAPKNYIAISCPLD